LFNSLVRIFVFVENTVVLDVFEGVVHKTTIAGLVSIGS
jgi:hypothetical protein